MLTSAKGADARHDSAKYSTALGVARLTRDRLARFLQYAKGADTRREAATELSELLRGAPDTAPVLRGRL